MTPTQRIADAFDRITAWMAANEAELLVENLAPGATPAALDAAEKAFGFTLPPQLRALWSVHDGQREEQNGCVGHMDLLGTQTARAEADSVKMFVEFLRENPDDWEDAGVTEAEITSDLWVAFAGRGYADLLVVSGVSGRVFWCGKDAPTLQHRAATIVEWAERYAARVAADDYALEEGFGDYHLSERDRSAEAAEAADDARRAAAEKHRRDTPVLEQLKAALDRGDDGTCRDVFEAAARVGQLDAAVALLFGQKRSPELIATSLQFVLGQVTLSKDHWKIVAAGAAKLGNHAIRDQAEAKAK